VPAGSTTLFFYRSNRLGRGAHFAWFSLLCIAFSFASNFPSASLKLCRAADALRCSPPPPPQLVLFDLNRPGPTVKGRRRPNPSSHPDNPSYFTRCRSIYVCVASRGPHAPLRRQSPFFIARGPLRFSSLLFRYPPFFEIPVTRRLRPFEAATFF